MHKNKSSKIKIHFLKDRSICSPQELLLMYSLPLSCSESIHDLSLVDTVCFISKCFLRVTCMVFGHAARFLSFI
jgi:hypothetical protein